MEGEGKVGDDERRGQRQRQRHHHQSQLPRSERMMMAGDVLPYSSSGVGHFRPQQIGMSRSRTMESPAYNSNKNNEKKASTSKSYDTKMTKPRVIPRSRSSDVLGGGSGSSHGRTMQNRTVYPYARNRPLHPDGPRANSSSSRNVGRIVSNPSNITTDTLTPTPGAIAIAGHPDVARQFTTTTAGHHGARGEGRTFALPSSNDHGQGVPSTRTTTSPPAPPGFITTRPRGREHHRPTYMRTQSVAAHNDDDTSLPIAVTVASDATTSNDNMTTIPGASNLLDENQQSDIARRVVNTVRQHTQNEARRQQQIHQPSQIPPVHDPPQVALAISSSSVLNNQQQHTAGSSSNRHPSSQNDNDAANDKNNNNNNDDDDDDNQEQCCCVTMPTISRGTFVMVLIGLIVIGALLGAVIILAANNARGKDNQETNIKTVMTTDTLFPSAPPTPSPPTKTEEEEEKEDDDEEISSPSLSPTLSPTQLQRFDELWSIIGDLITINGHLISQQDETSVQYRSFLWLANDDPAQLDFSQHDPVELLERYVLAVLYFATRGPSIWINKYNFLSSSHVCNWNDIVHDDDIDRGILKGVICDFVYARELSLDDNFLIGALVPELALLQSLSLLNLNSNLLTGTIPSELFSSSTSSSSSTLPALTSILLYSNELTGTIPNEIFHLQHVLREFSVFRNNLSGTVPVGDLIKCTNLILLSLGDNELLQRVSIPSEFSQLTKLQLLELSLLELDPNLGPHTMPTEFGQLLQLEYLFLSQLNDMTGTIPTELGLLTNLGVVRLDGNQLTGTVPTELKSLTMLSQLDIHDTMVTGSVDEIFCDPPSQISSSFPNLELLSMDCASRGVGGNDVEIQCSCCTQCNGQ